ncbi:hypothetical protein AMAG_00539 [Allomyces macrogynus ATCC 38327]|uniref:Calponin-homology (CH) domain-containing protein n=1 Tax=Allomyces macrogynus (strain ATCC 38327) TaxID=578462 RepID=A0A0L0RVZ8_ALLM3|nr:hypothetical protein AMAG_00539 [Allomyces macrogynus ATCC 38327]|eukprot:KNE54572.1 hypothetical protein AMAG_00539 [Allomyces macrogynus ATCC 38327]
MAASPKLSPAGSLNSSGSNVFVSPTAVAGSQVHGVHGRVRLGKDVDLPTSASEDASGAPNQNRSWMDVKRKNIAAYEYLCRIGEAKQWVEACIQEELPPVTALDEGLRNGVALAKLARAFEPELVRKIFEDPKLQFRHSDNINYCFQFMKKVGLPPSFMFELTDLYDLKNVPKVIYAIHALSHLLAKKGIAPKIKNLIGKLDFTEAEVTAMQENLDKSGIVMPSFGNVDKTLEKEMAPQTEEERRLEYLRAHEDEIVQCQAVARRHLARKRAEVRREEVAAQRRAEEEARRVEEEARRVEEEARELQRRREQEARVREVARQKREKEVLVPAATAIQAAWRGTVVRKALAERDAQLAANVHAIIALQSRARGYLARKHYAARRNFYRKNEGAIVSIQSWLKSKKQHSAYSSLMNLDNPPLPVVAKFLHLLDLGVHDVEEELAVENMKELAVKQIRENAALEAHLNDLDIKIALLVKNRITLDEVVKISSKKLKKTPSDEEMKKAAAVFQVNLKSLDKTSRDRLEAYQNMFYLLQTQPKYLTRLLWVMRNWSSDVVKRLIETCVLTLFSYAQNAREEYLLLKLLNSAIDLEVQDVEHLGDFVQGNPAFIKIVLQYVRGAKDRQYLQSVLQPCVKRVCDCTLDLELDPVQVYKLLIKEEESNTGKKSTKKYDVSREDAVKDPQTRERLQTNYQALEKFVSDMLESIISSLGRMPYGIRYIAKQLLEALSKGFPKEGRAEVLRVVGNLIYYRYMNPAIVAPDAFDVYHDPISPLHRKNLSEVSKMLNVIATGKQLDAHLEFAEPYVRRASQQFLKFLEAVTNVPAPEVQLNIDGYSDAARTTKPVIYVSPNEIFSMHATIHQHMEEVCGDPDDPLRKVLDFLGTPPSFQQDKTGPEISLTLMPRFAGSGDADKSNDYELRRLYVATKKQLVMAIRVQSNATNLLDLLECPATDREEERYREMTAGSPTSLYASVASMNTSNTNGTDAPPAESFAQFKRGVLEAMARLEAAGLVTRHDKYASMMASIVQDIRCKHRRRMQLQLEKASLETTLGTLKGKHDFLVEQEKSYMDYINACIQQLTAHHGSKKRRTLMPFSRHARHVRDLERKNKAVPKFGSFKYSAKELMDRGVIVSIEVDGLPSKLYDRLNVTLSSDEQGVFDVECTFSALGYSAAEHDTVKLEELLALQFENKTETQLFDGSVTVNVNLLIYFINKKFYA